MRKEGRREEWLVMEEHKREAVCVCERERESKRETKGGCVSSRKKSEEESERNDGQL